MQQQKSSLALNFAESLRSARGKRSQAEFARYLGIKHQQTYQAYESGRVPDGETLHQISTKLGVTIDALLSGGSQADLEAAGKKVLLDPSETPWGKELEENTQMIIAINLFCARLTYVQLAGVMKDVLDNDKITPAAKVFWMKLLTPWTLAHMDAEDFASFAPEQKISKREEMARRLRSMREAMDAPAMKQPESAP
jgi:transcriptional regulator with XRE-family HTH domain